MPFHRSKATVSGFAGVTSEALGFPFSAVFEGHKRQGTRDSTDRSSAQPGSPRSVQPRQPSSLDPRLLLTVTRIRSDTSACSLVTVHCYKLLNDFLIYCLLKYMLSLWVPTLWPRVNPYGPKVTPWVAPKPVGPRVSPYGYSSGELYTEYGWRISAEMSARRGRQPARVRGRPARYADPIDDPIPDPPPPIDPLAPEVPPIPRGQTAATDPPPAPSIDVTTPVRGASAGAVRAANVVPEVPISQTLISSGARTFTGSPDGAPTDA
ncbi:hypothetical protein V6N13_064987 [Hibiscus sabdariffa]